MTQQHTVELAIELSGRQKLVYEACVKIQDGERLVEQGRLELSNLLGEKATKKSDRHNDENSTFKMDVRKDDDLKEKIVKIIRLNRQASTALIAKKLKLSDRRFERLIAQLAKAKMVEDIGQSGRHAWVLTERKPKLKSNKAAKKAAKTRKSKKKEGHISELKVNGHKLKGGRGMKIDVTDQSIIDRATNFLKTSDWVSKGKFIDAVNLSPGVANRLITHMKKQEIIKQVYKKNNPAHDKHGLRKLYVRLFPYLELT